MITKIILLMGIIFSSQAYSANECSIVPGKFANPAYNGHVELEEVSPEVYQLIFRISCGTKVIPQVFSVKLDCIAGQLTMVSEGHSLCYTGNNPTFMYYGDKLKIHAEGDVRTPGFDGNYILDRVGI